MKVNLLDQQEEHSVFCKDCECILLAEYKSPLWWKAKKRLDAGYLDMLTISGEECTCIIPQPSEPFVVFGFDGLSFRHYEYGFNTMVEAIKVFKNLQADIFGDVCIKGVSQKVQRELEDSFFRRRVTQ